MPVRHARVSVFKPSDMMRERLEKHVPIPIARSGSVYKVMERIEAVDGLARLIDEAMTENTTSDGRLDLRAMASYMLDKLEKNQK